MALAWSIVQGNVWSFLQDSSIVLSCRVDDGCSHLFRGSKIVCMWIIDAISLFLSEGV